MALSGVEPWEAELRRRAEELRKVQQADQGAAHLASTRGGSGGGMGQLMQGMRGVGRRYAPQLKQAAGAAMQGAGAAAGWVGANLAAQPIKGFAGWFMNFWPENIYGVFVWGAAFLYWLDWQTGFNIASTSNFHLGFAIVAFLIIGLTQKYITGWALLSSSMFFLSLLGFINAPTIQQKGIGLVAVVIGAGFFYTKVNAPGFFKLLPVIALVDVYGMPMIRDRIMALAPNISYVTFATTFMMNRILFPVWLWFGALALYENARVARRVLAVILIFYFVAALPTLTNVYKAKVAGITPEEREQATGIWQRFMTNVQRILSGDFLKAPIDAGYKKAEQLFGFGEPEKEPAIGLVMRNDRTMPKEFDITTGKRPNPGIIIAVENPFPADVETKYIEIVRIDCDADVEGTSLSAEGRSDGGITPSYEKPLEVYYTGSGGGTGVTCDLADSGTGKWKVGDYSMDVKVQYKVDADAYLTNTFMRSDLLRDLRRTGIDPLKVKDIKPAFAEYDNGPIAVTWGPAELVTTPAGLDISTSPTPGESFGGGKSGGGASRSFGGEAGGQVVPLRVYISKTGSWEEGKIGGIIQLTVKLPQGVSFAEGDYCDFEASGDEWAVVRNRIRKKNDDLRFIGESVRFDCGMVIPAGIMAGAELATLRFDASGDFIFETETKGIKFSVKGDKDEEKKPA